MGLTDLLFYRLPRWLEVLLMIGVVALVFLYVPVMLLRQDEARTRFLAQRSYRQRLRFQSLRQAKSGLEEIAEAQERYRAENGQYASAGELVESPGLLPPPWARQVNNDDLVLGMYSYTVVVPLSPEQRAKHWCCYAEPVRRLSLHSEIPEILLFTDHTGILLLRDVSNQWPRVDGTPRPRFSAYRAGRSETEPGLEPEYDLGRWYHWEVAEEAYRKGWF